MSTHIVLAYICKPLSENIRERYFQISRQLLLNIAVYDLRQINYKPDLCSIANAKIDHE